MSWINQSYYRLLDYNKWVELCFKCPEGCKCSNETGCDSCSKESLREVRNFTEGSKRKICDACIANAEIRNGRCVCTDGSSPTLGQTCGCADTEIYSFGSNGVSCLRCPLGCQCNRINGCHFCDKSSFRNVSFNQSTGKYECGCVRGARVVGVEQTCVCAEYTDTG